MRASWRDIKGSAPGKTQKLRRNYRKRREINGRKVEEEVVAATVLQALAAIVTPIANKSANPDTTRR